MNLAKKKVLSAKVLGVGINRVRFNNSRLSEVKEALTKQDIKDLFASGAIFIQPVSGRRAKVRRSTRRGPGSIKQVVRTPKRDYIILTRKLRSYLAYLRRTSKITKDKYLLFRKNIRAKAFRSLAHMKEHLSGAVQ